MPTNKMTGQRNVRRSKNQKIGGQKQKSLRGGSSPSKSSGNGRKSSSRTSH